MRCQLKDYHPIDQMERNAHFRHIFCRNP